MLKTFAYLFTFLAFVAVAPGSSRAQTPSAPAATAPGGQAPAAPSATAPPLTTPTEIGKDLDKVNAALAEIEKSLLGGNDADLQRLSAEMAPLGDQVQGSISKLTPRLAALQAALDQLGPKPDEKAPPESPAVTAERSEQQEKFNENSDLLKRANLLALQVEQASKLISAHRHALFTNSLLQRATSILSPSLWLVVAEEIPGDFHTVKGLFSDWLDGVNQSLSGWRSAAFWGVLGGIFLLYGPAAYAARRVLSREPAVTAPTTMNKVLAAWWVALMIIILPVATLYTIAFVCEAFGLTNSRLSPIFQALGFAVLRIAMARGLSQGLFAPKRPLYRLPKISDKSASRLVQAAVAIAVIVSITRLFEALTDAIGTSVSILVATRSLGSLIGGLALGAALWSLGDAAEEEEKEQPLSAGNAGDHDWFGLFRTIAWFALAIIMGSVLSGYAALSSFLLDQVLWVSALGSILYLLIVLIDQVVAALVRPSTHFAQRLAHNIGLQRNSLELIAIFLSGLIKFALVMIAFFLALAPWRPESSDLPNQLRSAYFGFNIGGVTLSPASVIGAILVFFLAYLAFNAVQQWLDKTLLPHTRLDFGLRNSIKVSFGYVGFIVAFSMAMAYLGLSFERLAFIAGALSVGVGFGLQSIVSNFVSGLIILWERAVRVGDWIVVGADQGFVRRINIRSTEIETFDRASVIIPNSSLITGVVKNLLRNDTTGRITISIAVNAASDPEKVREVLIDIAKTHDLVLGIPSPQVMFTTVSGSTLNFELTCCIGDVMNSQRVKSDLNFEIYRRFKIEKFFDGPAADPTTIKILDLEQIESLVERQLSTRLLPLPVSIQKDSTPKAEPGAPRRGSAG